ncbi:hypothetical protein ciss_01490 [Carboxydothermus islandicus]|uniref:Uncharacterized protein n=1 Tax=Carboxydothermus islandicus TaxID=661089 RepID=A0A1L8CZ46_9THEO|nr:hypothetical protein ciss_01490 [Carboxydothermus islandicus]
MPLCLILKKPGWINLNSMKMGQFKFDIDKLIKIIKIGQINKLSNELEMYKIS